MARLTSWYSTCLECGKNVEIFNGDVDFSLTLHKQSHKTLEDVNKGFDENQVKQEYYLNSSPKYCIECREDIKIVNNDITFSLQLHAQKHKSNVSDLSSDKPITGLKEKANCGQEVKKNTTKSITSILEGIFNTLPIGLKAHRAFITEKTSNNAICNLCEIVIEPIFSVIEHLKTKLHEDNTILIIKSLISAELKDQMEFVSFYDSNLYCNLCGCKIDLCSFNLHETVVNIFTHNAGRSHLSKKSNKSNSGESDKPLMILKTLALMDPVMNVNQHYVEYKMNPYYKCKVCNKPIPYSENEKVLLNNFKAHFNTIIHKSLTCPAAVSLLKQWDELDVKGKENHRFVEANKHIYCLACSCFVAPQIEQLLSHVQANSCQHEMNKSQSEGAVLSGSQLNTLIYHSFSEKEIVEKLDKPINQINESLSEQMPPAIPKSPQSVVTDEIDVAFNKLIENNSSINLNARFLERKEKQYFCKICNEIVVKKIDLKLLGMDLIQHIKGAKHLGNSNNHLGNILNKTRRRKKVVAKTVIETQQKQQNFSEMKVVNMVGFNGEFEKLLNTDKTIKINSNYLKQEDGRIFCILCRELPVSTCKSKYLKNIIVCHVTGKKHIKRVEKAFNAMLDEAEISNSVIKMNRKFILKKDGLVVCTICEWEMPTTNDNNTLLKNLISHLEGTEHVSKIEKEGSKPLVFSQPIKSVQTGLEPQQHSLTSSTEKDTDCLIAMFEKLLETNETIKLNAPYLKQQNNDIICSICQVVCVRDDGAFDTDVVEQSILSHITGKEHIERVQTASGDLIKKYFDSLPVNYMEDIDFTTLSPIKGCISCRLCNCTIPSRYLKVHLDDTQHIQIKESVKGSNILFGLQQEKNDRNKKFGTLSTLLHNIDQKSPWEK